MPNKSYTPQEREDVRKRLLATGLALYSKRGIREVYLSEILQVVGISKPFFYKFYGSLAEFVIAVINAQWETIAKIMDANDERHDGCWRARVRNALHHLIHHREHGMLVMTQEEEVWVRARLSDAMFDDFMSTQDMYFKILLERWGIPSEKCSPRRLSNMILSIIVIYNSGQRALPFLYAEELEHTAQAQAEALVLYLESLRTDA